MAMRRKTLGADKFFHLIQRRERVALLSKDDRIDVVLEIAHLIAGVLGSRHREDEVEFYRAQALVSVVGNDGEWRWTCLRGLALWSRARGRRRRPSRSVGGTTN